MVLDMTRYNASYLDGCGLLYIVYFHALISKPIVAHGFKSLEHVSLLIKFTHSQIFIYSLLMLISVLATVLFYSRALSATLLIKSKLGVVTYAFLLVW